jgi:capsular exopolysaccharide synthesis family protein
MPKKWDSQVRLVVGNAIGANTPDYNAQLLAQQLAQTYSEIATTAPILQNVIDELKLNTTIKDLGKNVSADAPRQLTIVDISVTDNDPNEAAAIANAIGDQLVQRANELGGQNPALQTFIANEIKSTQEDITTTSKQVDDLAGKTDRTPEEDNQLNALQNRLATLTQSYAALLNYSAGNVANKLTVVEPARAADEPASPRPLVNFIAAIVVGLLLGIGLAFVLEHLDDTIKGPEQVGSALGLPTLATISTIQGLAGREPIYRLAMTVFPRSSAAESFRMLRTNLGFASVDRPLRLISVTSAMPNEGKTLVAANLAVAFAQAGHETILVDTDLRKPEVHKLFGLSNAVGLTNLLRSTEPNLQLALQTTVEPRLRLVASGTLPPNPAELLGSKSMATVIERLRKEAEIVVFDTPPLQAVTDAAVLAASLDGTLLVAHAGQTGRAAAQSAVDALNRVGARVLGVVLNLSGRRWIDTYGYYENPEETAQEESQAVVDGVKSNPAVSYRRSSRRSRRPEAIAEEPPAGS